VRCLPRVILFFLYHGGRLCLSHGLNRVGCYHVKLEIMSELDVNSYSDLQKFSEFRRKELGKLYKPYLDVTDRYGQLICDLSSLLGKLPPSDVQEKVIRDLMADVFDNLYESRNIILTGQLNVAYPLIRRAYESLSLLVLCALDVQTAQKWQDGKQISNNEVRKGLAKHPFGEKEENLRELYKFFSEASHPNRGLIPERYLGEGNEFVFGAIGMPDLVMVTDYCLKHLDLWFWFAAVISTLLAPKTDQDSTTYRSKYLAIAKDAQWCCDWLRIEFNRLLIETQNNIG